MFIWNCLFNPFVYRKDKLVISRVHTIPEFAAFADPTGANSPRLFLNA
jgi:hypothetical protein